MSWRQYAQTGLSDAPGDRAAFQAAERLVRRLVQLYIEPPPAAEDHPAWHPAMRQAVENATRAIGRGDAQQIGAARMEIERLAATLNRRERSSSAA